MKQDFLIYGKEYHIWRDKKYLGVATWTDDNNIGEAFIKTVINDTNETVHQVFNADEWEFFK